MRKRIIADVFVFCLFLWAPWQLTAAFVIIFLIYFPNYWEGRRLPLWRIPSTLCPAFLDVRIRFFNFVVLAHHIYLVHH